MRVGLKRPQSVALTPEERAYAYTRTVGSIGLLLAYFVGFIGLDDALAKVFYLTAALGFLAVSLAQGAARTFLGVGPRRSLYLALPADLVWIALATSALLAYGDAGYVIAIVWPIFYAIILKERQAWVVGGFVAAAYLCGHFGALDITAGEYAFLVLKAVAIVLLTGRIAYTQAQQRHDAELLKLADEEKAELTAQLTSSLTELRALYQINAYLHSSLEIQDVGGPVLESIAEVFGFSASCMYVVNKVTSDILFSATRGIPLDSALPGDPDCDALVALDDGGESLACTCPYDQDHLRLVFCAPSGDLEALSHQDHVLLDTVGREVISAVESAELYKLTKTMSITDELTGLFNYRFLQKRIQEEVARARRTEGSFALLMIDADDFKAFNDMYGHVAGDEVLAELGSVLQASVRTTDLVARYGGEEFSVLCPDTDMDGAMAVAEKLRDNVALHHFQPPYDRHLSVSIGLATFPLHGIDAESVLRAADDALYGAKNSGKNQVHSPGVYVGQPVW